MRSKNHPLAPIPAVPTFISINRLTSTSITYGQGLRDVQQGHGTLTPSAANLPHSTPSLHLHVDEVGVAVEAVLGGGPVRRAALRDRRPG